MNSLTLAALCCAGLYLGYLFYGRIIARLWDFQPDRPTPAQESPDGVDYVAARHWTVLFGHHFASIAGVGPIVGPLLACAVWGWLPTVLWVVIGSVFLGAVHDFSSLMASLRARGKSIAEMAETNLGHRVRVIFGAFLWLALILVVAVFAHFGAQTLAMTPQVVIPTFGVIVVALIVGYLLYQRNMPQAPATVIGLALLGGCIYLGYRVPIELPWGEQNILAWTLILLAYAYVASITPVNLLLQPRDYLSTFVLYLGLLAGYTGLVLTRPDIQAPAVRAFSSDTQGPLWPMLFVIVACGAISGFHSLIASGTTAKQLGNEGDAPRIGYGAMIIEGALAVLAVVAVVAGLKWSGQSSFTELLAEKGPLGTFAAGFAALTRPIFRDPFLGSLVALTILKTFVMTTLDSATRITRYIGEELFADGLGLGFLRNRFMSTALIVGAALYLALGSWQNVWPVFGSANQLIAALALLVLTVILWRRGKATVYTLVPFLFMMVTTIGALIYQG
ncbi:MAG: carbon starvation protein A, partial [Armatimonadetes bacterium]|nr:carbon starvation protein A [Armatimonadota bacterium]